MDKLSSLIDKIVSLETEKSRKISSFVGAIVGDAACIHLEWIYDETTLTEKLNQHSVGKGLKQEKDSNETTNTKNVTQDQDPAFWPDSHCPFFTLPNGSLSCYGDQAIQTLNVMVYNDGIFDSGKLIQHFLHHFGDEKSPYQVALIKRRTMKWPIEGPWLQGQDPAFWPESHCPFYTLPNGKLSCYADQAIQSLNVLVANNGKFDSNQLIQHFLHYFGDPKSPYQIALFKRRNMKWPIEGPWLHGALISMMDRYKADINPPGSEDANEHDGLVTALPLILQQAPNNFNLEELHKCLHIMTQDPESIQHHEAETFLIHAFIKGTDDPIGATKIHFEKNEMIIGEINAVLDGKKANRSAQDLVKTFGWTCPMPGSFQGSLVSIIDAKSYADAIRETIICGGDCCARSILIGACLGAKFGIENIPREWIMKVENIEYILEKCLTLFG